MNSRHASVLLLLALGALPATVPSFAAADDAPASPEVTAALQPYLDGYKLAGAVAVIADKSGHIHYKNLLGYADVEAKRPVSEDNVFWVASMSKMFVGASVMMLVDEGKLSLDHPAAKHIPQLSKWMVVAEKDDGHVLLKKPARPVTLRHLLSHTSGLARSAEVQQVAGQDATPLKARALASVTGRCSGSPARSTSTATRG